MTTILDAVRNGRPIDFTPFIDVHGHFGPWYDTTVPYCLDHGRLIAEMDRYGCDMAWMPASDPGYSAAMRTKNDYVFGLAAEYPDRVIPYCTLSANEPDRCLEELDRCLGLGRCIGVKMHRYVQPEYTMKSAFLQPVLERLAEHKLVYLNHTFYPDVAGLEWALARYPDLVFMAGHFDPSMNDLARRFPNARDSTCAVQDPGAIEREIRRFGRSDTMLVGSDFGLLSLSFGFGILAYAQIEEADKRNILGLNAVKLLERTAWYSPRLLRCTRDEASGSPTPATTRERADQATP